MSRNVKIALAVGIVGIAWLASREQKRATDDPEPRGDTNSNPDEVFGLDFGALHSEEHAAAYEELLGM